MSSPISQVNNALKNVTTSIKDITQVVLSAKNATQFYEQLKVSSKAEDLIDAIDTVLKALLK